MVGLEMAHSLCQRARLHDYVCVGEEEQLAPGSFCALVQSIVFPEPAWREFRDAHKAKARICCCHLCENGRGLIG